MARYIDADKLDDLITQLNNEGRHITRADIKMIDHILSEIPTADVRENVKGEWIVGELYNEPCTCSVCKHTFPRKAYFLYSYCPNCGAEMSQ